MQIIDSYFESVYNQAILQEIEQRFGSFSQHHVDLSISTQGMVNLMAKMNRKSRRGEVVMVIPNEEGDIWLHTKIFYQAGVYRLMTGGLDPGENPLMGFKRELKEETGFNVDPNRCLGVITYTLTAQEMSQPFVSYVFKTKPIGGHPDPTGSGEAISGFKAVPASRLGEVARHLSSLQGHMADWGNFRAPAHTIVQKQLQRR